MQEFSHLNKSGEANMVDVSSKAETHRLAVAQSRIVLGAAIMAKVNDQSLAKGDLLATARIAGIQAAKKCSDLIPLCHPLPLRKVSIDFTEFNDGDQRGLSITASCTTTGKTGVEMEALTAASVAALTVYDMCKSVDREMQIGPIQLEEKSGGKSGHFVRGTSPTT